MNREETRKWFKELEAFAQGEELYTYNEHSKEWYHVVGSGFNLTDIIVIQDEHFEARKAYALGEDIECRDNGISGWSKVLSEPFWSKGVSYRPKGAAWEAYATQENPILCWVWTDDKDEGKYAARVCYIDMNTDRNWKYETVDAETYKYARPLTDRDCWKVTR